MASGELEVELEDGEINDLEDGEIDEDVCLPEEPFSLPRQEEIFRGLSYEPNGREPAFHNPEPFARHWEDDPAYFQHGRHGRSTRGRASIFSRGTRRKQLLMREHVQPCPQLVPGKTRRRGNHRRTFQLQPNLSQALPDERPRVPYSGGRVPGFIDNERPRLPYFGTFERQRTPLSDLGEKTRQSYNKRQEFSPPLFQEEQPRRAPSPFDEDVDDYSLLLERHRLIQQQLDALEKQEHLADDEIIDDTFVDIPINENEQNIDSSLGKTNESGNQEISESQQPDTFGNVLYFETSDKNTVLETENGTDCTDEKANEQDIPKLFLPFRIKPQYSTMPTIQELSKQDLEQRQAKQVNEYKVGNDNLDRTSDRTRTQMARGKARRRRQRKSKQKVTPRIVRHEIRNKDKPGTVDASSFQLSQSAHVDPHNELEKRLMSLAASSVAAGHDTEETKRDDPEKQKQRRERLRQWHTQHVHKENFPSHEERQQANLSKPKKKSSRAGVTNKRKSAAGQGGKETDILKKSSQHLKFESDDYYEIPMDVESDSPEGPALPLIEETHEDLPPPPPPLPNGEHTSSGLQMYSDHSQQPLLVYQAGYYPNEQMYPEWIARPMPMMQPVIDNQQISYEGYVAHNAMLAGVNTQDFNHEYQHGQAMEEGSKENSDDDGDDGEDDDDEAALRELLLKSLADKRKAKMEQANPSATGSVPSSQRVQSPKAVTSVAPSHSGRHQSKKQQQKQEEKNSKQVTFAPPKHDPVVIKLGTDSDTEESDASDKESAPKAALAGKPKNKGNKGSLFGGLEMMIKEARKSAEASRVKGPSNTTKSADADTPNQQDLPPEPTTPDAMAHMPEQMKTEYKRLKKQLAMRESEARQPMISVNQEKGDRLQETSSEEVMDVVPKDDHLTELQNRVTVCEVSLARQRKLIQSDQSALSNMMADLVEKSKILEAQEVKVRKLQQQLEVAQKATLANRMVVRKKRDRIKLLQQKFSEKQLAASNLEEEMLRTKSILSAVKRGKPQLPSSSTGRDSPRPRNEGVENSGNNNQKIIITASTAQEMKSSLDAKLNQLLLVLKEAKGGVQAKRKLKDTSDLSQDTVAKKAPVSSAVASKATLSNTRKSMAAERIAQEKARLKKLEHELAEKLKSYSRKPDKEDDTTSYDNSSSAPGQSQTGSRLKQPVPMDTNTSDQSVFVDTKVNTKNQREGLSEDKESPMEPVEQLTTGEVSIDDKQYERIRKLQAEKVKKGPQFPSFNLDVPLTAHQLSTLCVSLPFGRELKSLVTEHDATKVGDGGRKNVELVISRAKDTDDVHVSSDPQEKYKSKLLYFKSYRLSPYFRTQEGFSLSSLTFTNKLDPLWPLCDFDLKGKCNDEDCRFQHVLNCKLPQEEILQDLASYDPSLSGDGIGSKELNEQIVSYTRTFAKQYQDKMSWEEICILLVNEVKKRRKLAGPLHVFLKPRTWKLQPQMESKKVHIYEEDKVLDLGRGIKLSQKDSSLNWLARKSTGIDSQTTNFNEESQEVRYFVEEYNNMRTLEKTLEHSPGDVALWIKLARLKLCQQTTSGHQKDQDMHNNKIRQALNILSRGLEENTHSEELWLEYLDLYASQSNSAELREICEQAVEFSPTYSIWWQYLELSQTCHDKRAICLRLLSFLVAKIENPVELHSQRLLETLLYLVQLELYCGHYRSAVAVFQAALAKKPGKFYEVPDLSTCMLSPDYCLAWLAYIHVVEFHRLPAPWFDPCQSRPARMVSKEEFVFPWKPSQQSRASGEKLLGLFQDALKACSCLVKPPAHKVTACLPLYKNLIALEMAYDRLSSAKGICKHLLKDNHSEVVLWQCLAILEGKMGRKFAAEQVYTEAMDKCLGHAELSYSAARFHLEQNDTRKAIAALVRCVYEKFVSVRSSSDGEVLSLAVVVPEQEGPDPVALYRRLLSQPLPYNYKCPPFMPGVTPQSLGREKVYLWLCYCLLLEISPSGSSGLSDATVESAFETAVHCPLDRQDVQTLWREYLFYKASKVLEEKSSSPQLLSLEEMVNRCLVCVSTTSAVPLSSSCYWQDYRFHNQVISLLLSCLPKLQWSAAFEKFLRLFPGDVGLALWACQHELDLNNLDEAKKISGSFLSDNPTNITMWKVAIAIELKRNCVKEARKMYQQATEILPFAATLWKDFLMFVIAQSGNGSAAQEMVEKCRQIGVDLEEFLNTLLGK